MNKQSYELLGISETATDEEVTARYQELKKKYSEDRFLEGEAGNEAARMLNKIDVAYNEIMSERKETRGKEDNSSSYAKVDAYIREGKIAEAQAVLDEFNERPAEWHYLQSVVFYKKNWITESKKQLEIAIQMDSSNEKYRTAYNKLKEKIDYDKKQADAAHGQGGYAQGTYSQGEGAPDYDTQQQQMGGGFCEQCATCCACNMLFNCCMNACCGCH